MKAHQRPKLEVYGTDVFVVLKTARYVDACETVEFAEIQLFVGAQLRGVGPPRQGARRSPRSGPPSRPTPTDSASGRWPCSTP